MDREERERQKRFEVARHNLGAAQMGVRMAVHTVEMWKELARRFAAEMREIQRERKQNGDTSKAGN